MNILRLAALACLVCLLLVPAGAAQTITGYTTVDIDPDTGKVTAICETDLDADTAAYYEASVTCALYGDGTFIGSRSNSDTRGISGSTVAVFQFAGVPGTTYTAIGTHTGIIQYRTYEYSDLLDPSGFYDAYNFGYFDSLPLETYPDTFDWFGPGPPESSPASSVETGQTTATKNYPKATISLAFTPSGTKNPQDHLSFLNDSRNCSETFGPKDCNTGAEWWFYNLEGTVAVSDDASLWTVNQTKSSIVYSGNTKDANGVLHPFSNTLTFTDPSDGPVPPFLQNQSGSKTIFWIDAPGRRNLGDDGNTIDSLNWVQNYTMKVCSTVLTTICSSQSWYVKLVVNPGGLLSPTASIAALGSSN